jgi:hypothetical protein
MKAIEPGQWGEPHRSNYEAEEGLDLVDPELIMAAQQRLHMSCAELRGFCKEYDDPENAVRKLLDLAGRRPPLQWSAIGRLELGIRPWHLLAAKLSRERNR